MAELVCKMCCAPLEVLGNGKFAKCSYCGTLYTLPLDSESESNAMIKATPLLEMGRIFLADGKFGMAAECFDKVIELLPTYGEAYLGRGLTMLKIRKVESMKGNRAMRTFALKNYYFMQALAYCRDPLLSRLRNALDVKSENDDDIIVIRWRKKVMDIRRDFVQDLRDSIKNENPEYAAEFKAINDRCHQKIKSLRDEEEKLQKKINACRISFDDPTQAIASIESFEKKREQLAEDIEQIKNEQGAEIKALQEKYPDRRDYVSFADYQAMTERYPLPEIHTVKSEGIVDKVYDILLSRYSEQSEDEIASHPLCEGVNPKRVLQAIRKLVYDRRILEVETAAGTCYQINDIGDILIK